MEVFLATIVVFLLAVLGMSVGMLFGRGTFKGTCRGPCGECDHSVPHECRYPEGSEPPGGDAG